MKWFDEVTDTEEVFDWENPRARTDRFTSNPKKEKITS